MSKPTPTPRAAFRYWETFGTRWSDNDIYGHMNNSVYYHLFDTVVNNFLLKRGILSKNMRDPVYLVVANSCDYFAELAYPQDVEAGVLIEHLGRSSVRYRVGLFAQDAPLPAAEGHFVHVNVHPEKRTPLPIAPQHRAAFAPIAASSA